MELCDLKNKLQKLFLKIFHKLIGVIYIFAERCVAKNDSLCFISYPDCSDNAWELFKYLKNRSEIKSKIIWLVKDVEFSEKKLNSLASKNLSEVAILVKKNSLQGIWYFLKAKHVFFTHGHYSFVGKTGGKKLINLWHGMPIKAIGLLDNKVIEQIQASDCVIGTSDFFGKIMGQAFSVPMENIIVSGQPRCDALFSPEKSPSWMQSVFKNPFKKIILWMPTYRISAVGEIRNDGNCTIEECRSEFERQISLVNVEAIKSNVQVLVKLHPMDFLGKFDWPDLDCLKVYPANHQFFDNVDIYQLLNISSGLLTDISSVAIDYILTRKPLCVVWPKSTDYTRPLLFEEELLSEYCDVIYDYEKVGIFFRRVFENKELDAVSVQERFLRENECIFHTHVDGGSCARLAVALEMIN